MPESVALSIHGPAGVLDLRVPAGATAHDVARSYAHVAGLETIPLLQTPMGEHLGADREVTRSGLRSGDVLVAVAGLPRARAADDETGPAPGEEHGRGPLVTAVAAAVVALLAGWVAAGSADPGTRIPVVACLVAGGLLALLPVGRRAHEHALVAPAFGASAAYAVLAAGSSYQPPAVVAACALVAAAVAAVARTVARERVGDGLLVWMVGGLVVAAVCGGAVLLGLAPQVPWALLVAGAVLAARVGPSYAVAVPDQVLLDLERLAVTAWSARDQRPEGGRRGATTVPEATVRHLVGRASRLVTAIAAAVLVVVLVAATRLPAATTAEVDLLGARALLLLAGGALLLAARGYRHGAARLLLRLAGLWCLVVAALELSRHGGEVVRHVVLGGSVLGGLVCVAVAVATGRGWRSVWWSRRAELAETLCGTLAIASTAVAVGLVRHFWEMGA